MCKKAAAARGAPEAREEEEEDVHLKLVKAPDWGAVGPVKEPTVGALPRKPNKKQRSTTISPRSKKPRDRLAEGAITFTGDSRSGLVWLPGRLWLASSLSRICSLR